MDGESSCESDISESWSLIDLNLSEQLDGEQHVAKPDDPTTFKATPKEIIKTENDSENKKNENFELMEFSNNSSQVDEHNEISSSTFDNNESPQNASGKPFQDFIFLDEEKKLSEDETDKIEGVKFDSDVEILEGEHKCRGKNFLFVVNRNNFYDFFLFLDTDFDTDGISVISEAECDERRGYYSSENDKNWEEELQTEYLNNAFEKNNQTVIKKRRKRVKVYSDSSDDNLNR